VLVSFVGGLACQLRRALWRAARIIVPAAAHDNVFNPLLVRNRSLLLRHFLLSGGVLRGLRSVANGKEAFRLSQASRSFRIFVSLFERFLLVLLNLNI